MNEMINERINGWMNERINECKNETNNGWMNE
jgi:hypothetical protein